MNEKHLKMTQTKNIIDSVLQLYFGIKSWSILTMFTQNTKFIA